MSWRYINTGGGGGGDFDGIHLSWALVYVYMATGASPYPTAKQVVICIFILNDSLKN